MKKNSLPSKSLTFKNSRNCCKTSKQSNVAVDNCEVWLEEIWMRLRRWLTSRPGCAHMHPCCPSVCMGNGSHSLSGCMCYFCWASHIEQTNNLFQLKRAAEPASVCRKGSVLQWITSALETAADCVLRGGGSRSAIVGRIADAMERAKGWLKQNKTTKNLTAEEEAASAAAARSWRLRLHVGRAGKLIMWLRLIGWCWGKSGTVKL